MADLIFSVRSETEDRLEVCYSEGPGGSFGRFDPYGSDLGRGSGQVMMFGIIERSQWKETGKLSLRLQHENERLRNRVVALEAGQNRMLDDRKEIETAVRGLMDAVGITEADDSESDE